jgi:hypothetical protein
VTSVAPPKTVGTACASSSASDATPVTTTTTTSSGATTAAAKSATSKPKVTVPTQAVRDLQTRVATLEAKLRESQQSLNEQLLRELHKPAVKDDLKRLVDAETKAKMADVDAKLLQVNSVLVTNLNGVNRRLHGMANQLSIRSLTEPQRAFDSQCLVSYCVKHKLVPWVHLTSLLQLSVQDDTGIMARCMEAARRPHYLFSDTLMQHALQMSEPGFHFFDCLRDSPAKPVFWIHRVREDIEPGQKTQLLADLRKLFKLQKSDDVRILQYDKPAYQSSPLPAARTWLYGEDTATALMSSKSPEDQLPPEALPVFLYSHPEDPIPGYDSLCELSAVNFARVAAFKKGRALACFAVKPMDQAHGYDIAEFKVQYGPPAPTLPLSSSFSSSSSSSSASASAAASAACSSK